jgi:hypothetical protein
MQHYSFLGQFISNEENLVLWIRSLNYHSTGLHSTLDRKYHARLEVTDIDNNTGLEYTKVLYRKAFYGHNKFCRDLKHRGHFYNT